VHQVVNVLDTHSVVMQVDNGGSLVHQHRLIKGIVRGSEVRDMGRPFPSTSASLGSLVSPRPA
jgi:hypothetical protein